MRPFEYGSAATLDEVVATLHAEGADAVRPLAGGTDLLTLIKADLLSPERLLDIKRVPELSGAIKETEQGVRLGALTTLAEIETHPLLRQRYSVLAEAASLAATPQLRNRATLGGNLLQRPRCWYFRDHQFHCWLKGGDTCHARDGQNQLHALFDETPCVAVHPSDLASALVALDALVRLRGPQGERTLPLQAFFALPEETRRTENVLGSDELIISIELPAAADGARSTYVKAMDRKVWAFALVGVAARVLVGRDRRIEDARLVLTGVAPVPWRVEPAEQMLIGNEIGDDLFARAAEAALVGAQPLEHNAYKALLATGLIRRALSSVTSGEGGAT